MDVEALRRVAELAELTLEAEEEPRLVADVSRILAYVAELEAVDTSSVTDDELLTAPLSPADAAQATWRRDEPAPSLPREDALAAAPETAEGGFAVPTFVE